MKPYTSNIPIKILLVFFLLPQVIFADSSLTPRMINHGSYKDFGPSNNTLRPLVGHVPKDVTTAKKITPMKEDKILKLSIVLPWNHEDELDQLVLDITNPKSEKFQHYLKQKDLFARYSPTVAQVEKATSFLSKHGLTILSITPNRLTIQATGAVKDINALFHTEIYNFTDKNGEDFFAPAYELQVDKGLPIIGVLGLENRIKPRRIGSSQPMTNVVNKSSLSACTPWPGPGTSFGLSPSQIKNVYSLTTPLTGTGQSVALVELDGFTQTDIDCYTTQFGPAGFIPQTILIDGFTGTPGAGAIEVTADIEMVLALAPGLDNLFVYEGHATAQGEFLVTQAIANDNTAKIVSTSWGFTESTASSSFIWMESALFKQMAAQGQTFFSASGDFGSYDNKTTLGVGNPQSQPLVVGVGGTSLTVNGSFVRTQETGWSNGSTTPACLRGGGGGISSLWGLPYWQVGIAGTNMASTIARNVPDVSLTADPVTGVGYAVYFNGWLVGGGTSLSSPLWAAFAALVNEARAGNNLASLGFFNPLIYQIGQSPSYSTAFYDVTTGGNGLGSNVISCSLKDSSATALPSNNLGPYSAGVGYDLATGWGPFMGDSLLSLLSTIDIPPPPCLQNDSDTAENKPCVQQEAKNKPQKSK